MSLKGKNVLVIDDNEDMRLLVRDILETAGLNVNEAGKRGSGGGEYHKPTGNNLIY
jgi:CheY-like chemotaxis protein